MIGARGVEPLLSAPKADVLPLHHTPKAIYFSRETITFASLADFAKLSNDCYNY